MIERLCADSRRCGPGTVFFAWQGENGDGRGHVRDALARGASAVVWEKQGWRWPAELRAPNAAVRELRRNAGALAHAFYGRPSELLWVCGVTGTNGKTSCSQWIAALLGAHSVRAGVIGTLGNGFPGALAPTDNTTPDALEIHRLLREMRDAGAKAVAMEVSSHALVQDRVNAVSFDCALFTNLSHDHLDYHGSFEAYGEAKAKLFESDALGCAVLNLDDSHGRRLAQRTVARGIRTIGYRLSCDKPDVAARFAGIEMVCAVAIEPGDRLTPVQIRSSWGEAALKLPLLGTFNVSNALGVLGCLIAYGLPFAEACSALESLPPVAGRMQRFGGGEQPLVVVDYAHTPDALEKVLAALRPVAAARDGRLAVVFGAGGDRDPSKRAPMGAAAAAAADRILLTSDNPRSEEPARILEAIAKGAGAAAQLDIEADRARAIERAVIEAASGDVILVAGKGHETYQEVRGRRLPFSDAAVVRAALAARGSR